MPNSAGVTLKPSHLLRRVKKGWRRVRVKHGGNSGISTAIALFVLMLMARTFLSEPGSRYLPEETHWAHCSNLLIY